ncbi:ATP-binding protein [Mycolicibacterium komossense]|uniref:AAA family ATPase n=1 Tax=Mycolicibacterium komossense TaxID=1779 RepID=A0ABT3CK58_9MYCO|nr:LuxR family transcriptional regulator [Mycolicibacterium komossense]MCV7229820.1 AAA family ATPase [Mycolicibacterium komossense]
MTTRPDTVLNPERRRRTEATPLRGRAEQLATIDAAIAGLRRGHGCVVLIEGPPGIGKSRLLKEVSTRAEVTGAQILAGAASEDQQSVAFGPLLTAIVNADPPIGDFENFRAIGADANLGFWVIQDMQAAISAAALRRPLLIAIDDLQWADAGTLQALRGMVTGLSRTPVMWALAARPAEARPAVRDALDAMTSDPDLHEYRIRLNGLGSTAIADMTADVVGTSVDEALLQVTEKAHGSPFLLLEVLRGLSDEKRIRMSESGATVVGDDPPQRLAESMAQRLSRLQEPTRRMVEMASILPATFSGAALATMLKTTSMQLYATVTEAIQADLLAEDGDSLTFQHDLLRQAARRSIPEDVRRSMERQSVDVLLGLGAEPAHVAFQLARSADMGDTGAVSTLRKAADSLTQSDPSGAADLGLRALDLIRPEDAQRPAVVAETVRRLVRAARNEEAQHLGSAAMSSTGLPVEVEATILQSLTMANDGYVRLRLPENRRALELSGLAPQTRARLLGFLAHNLMFDGQVSEARLTAEAARQAGIAIDDQPTLTLADVVLAYVDYAEGRGLACAQRVERLQSRIDATEVGVLAGYHVCNLMFGLGNVEPATALLDFMIDAAREHHHDEAFAIFTQVRAVGEFAGGRLGAARALVESLPVEQRAATDATAAQVGSVTMGAVAAHTDDEPWQQLLAGTAREWLSIGPSPRREGVFMLAHFAWQRGDIDAAAQWLSDDFDLLGTPMPANALGHVVLAARVVRTSGDAGLRQRVQTAIATLECEEPRLPHFAGVALHCRGLLENDLEALQAAVRTLADCGRPLLHAGATEDIGHLLARAGSPAPAIDRLTDAFETFHRCEAVADARRVAKALQQLGVKRRVVRRREESGWTSLTPAERKVLELVTEGKSNSDVAQELNLSRHTVVAHLRKIFSKLDIHTRAEAAGIAREHLS